MSRGGDNSAAHSALVNSILLALGRRKDCKFWKNPVGLFVPWASKSFAPPEKIGIAGQADIIGIVAPGLFMAIECKTGAGVARERQKDWEKMVLGLGARYKICRTVQDAIDLVEKKY